MLSTTRVLFLCIAMTLGGCVVGQMMTVDSFEQLQAGMTLAEVEESVGKPWELKPIPSLGLEAVYCERIRFDGQCRQERRYILIFQEGRLVSKRTFILQQSGKTGLKTF